jgi:hypothetical protein
MFAGLVRRAVAAKPQVRSSCGMCGVSDGMVLCGRSRPLLWLFSGQPGGVSPPPPLCDIVLRCVCIVSLLFYVVSGIPERCLGTGPAISRIACGPIAHDFWPS